jgi:DNA invertase Pin-like site-specific DNA recombinase
MVEVIARCSNPSVNRQFEQVLHLDLDFLDHPKTKLLDDGQQVAHSVSRRRHHLTQEQEDLIVRGYEAGSTLKQLGERFLIHRTTVSIILRKKGIPIRLQPLSPDQVLAARELYAGGMSLSQVSSKLSCEGSTVWRALKAEGVPLRDPQGRPRNDS